MARCNTQAKDKATTAKNWTTPGATVSGRYNTPPLQEDLVLRSRMAPDKGNFATKTRNQSKAVAIYFLAAINKLSR